MRNPQSNPHPSSSMDLTRAKVRASLARMLALARGLKPLHAFLAVALIGALVATSLFMLANHGKRSPINDLTLAAATSSPSAQPAQTHEEPKQNAKQTGKRLAPQVTRVETSPEAKLQSEPQKFPVPGTRPEHELQLSPGAFRKNEEEAEGEGEPENGDEIRARGNWFHDQRAYPFAHIPSGALQEAIQQRDAMKQRQRAQSQINPQAVITFPGDALWHLMGPQPVNELFSVNSGFPTASGRVTAIAVDPSDATGQTVYIGGAAGGVWKTTDGGAHWTGLTDTQPSLAVGSITIDPNNHNTIYVGTGEENFNGDAYYGAGILKSTDGGTTWTQMGASTFARVLTPQTGGALIGQIAVQPGNPNIVLAAVSFFVGGTVGGIYRSNDGGSTWAEDASPQGVAATQVVFESTVNAGTTATAWAAMGNPFGEAANGIYKSTDSGATWTKQAGGLPTTNVGRIILGYAPSTSGATATVYAAIASSAGGAGSPTLLGFFKTVNGGTAWTTLGSTPAFCNSQCFYDMAVGVHPTNPNFVVVGGGAFTNNSTSLFKTTDGGTTWSGSTPGTDFTLGTTSVRPHVDTHAFAYAANGAGFRFYVGNDGGMWRTDDPTPTPPLWVNLNATLATIQFYPGPSAGIGDENFGFGGTQDNDTELFSGNLAWDNVFACGDGGFTAIDPNIPTSVYTTCDRGAGLIVAKSVFNGSIATGQTFNAADSGIVRTDNAQFIPPLTMDLSNPNTLYFGTCRVYQTTDGANTWNPISGDLSAGNATPTTCPGNGAGTITTMDVAHQNSSVILAGTSNGKVWETTTGGILWNEIDAGLPQRHVTAVRTKRSDATGQIAYVTLSGFGACGGCGATPGHVFKTINGGASWTNISGDLPDIPVNDLIVDHSGNPTFDALYIGTDVGVFSCPDPEAVTPCTNWTVVGDGLPNSPVLGLAMRRSSRILRAATHGRSMWSIQLTDEAPPSIASLSSVTPGAVKVGAATLPVDIFGLNLSASTQVFFDGASVGAATFVDTTHLTISVNSSFFTDGHVFAVTLTDPQGADTSSLPFTVMNPILGTPTLTNPSTTAGVPYTLQFTGSKFVNSTTVTLTTFGNLQLTGGTANAAGTTFAIAVPASFLTTAMPVAGTITNPLPGGGPTPPFNFNFTINPGTIIFNPSPILLSTFLGTTSFPVTNVAVINTSASPVNITAQSITVPGTNPANFSFAAPTSGTTCNFPSSGQSGTGTITLAANGGTCNFGITYTAATPPGNATSTATLSVTDNASGSPQTAPIQGTPFPATVVLSPVNFGPVTVGTTSPTMNATLINATSSSINVTSAFTISGTNQADFHIVSFVSNGDGNAACPAAPFALASFASCDVTLTFTPSLPAGSEAAQLNVTATVPVTTINPNLTGIGIEITSISPSIVPTGGPAFTLTVNGGGFAPSAVVNLNGSTRLTTFVNANQLQASIPASDIATAGNRAITVTTPVPGGIASEPKTLIVAQATVSTNDNITFATSANTPPFRTTQDTTQATVNTGGIADPTPACAPGTATQGGKARSVWFTATPPTNGRVVFDTRFSSYPTILSAWTGTPGSLVAAGCISGNVPGAVPASQIVVNVPGGTKFFLMVSDASATGAGGTLTFSLDFQATAPANDDNATPTVIAAAPFSNSTNSIQATANTNAHADPTLPAGCATGAASAGQANSIWYKFTAPSAGTITADTLTSPYDTILNVTSGTPAGTQVACNNDAAAGIAQSQVSFAATSATTYFFMVSSFLGDGGTTNFHLTFNAGGAGTPTKLAFTTQPTNVPQGASITPAVQVTIEDASSNPVTTATNSVTMAIGTNPSAGTLSGTLSVAAVNGVASFPNLNINNTGVGYTLSASASTLTSATSNAFNVTASSTNNFTNGAGGNLWTTAGNWSLGHVPLSTETVTDTGGLNITLNTGAQTVNAMTFNTGGTLTISSGSLTFTGASSTNNLVINGGTLTANAALANGGTLALSSGTLTGSGQITSTGLFTWTGGLLAGTVTPNAVFNANGGVDFNGGVATGNGHQLSQRTLNLPVATTTFNGQSNSVTMSNGAIFHVPAGALLTMDQDGGLSNAQSFSNGGGAPASTVQNDGTIRKLVGNTGNSFFGVALSVSATGHVEVLSGTMVVGSGSTSTGGTFLATSPGVMNFNGSYVSDAATTFTGTGAAGNYLFNSGTFVITGTYNVAGDTTISGANVTFNSTPTMNTLHLSSGTLTGSAPISPTGLFTWTGGLLAGTVTPNAVFNANGGVDFNGGVATGNGHQLSQRTLNLPVATTTFNGQSNSVTMSNGAIFHVPAGALLTMDQDGGLSNAQSFSNGGGAPASTVQNDGTIRKLVGNTGNSLFGVQVNNTGLFEVLSGSISVGGNLTQTAGTTNLNGGNITGGSTLTYNGGVLMGTGTITGNVINNSGQVNPGHSPGTLNITGNYTQGATGILNIELGGTTAGNFDVLAISGTATLGGTLNALSFGGFVPPASSGYQVVTYASHTGDFATKNVTVSGVILAEATNATNVTLTAPGPTPASITANAGTTPQSATINTAFANALAVTVKDAGSNPISGVNVTFTAPAAGASGTFSNATATIIVATNASGVASAPFTANATAGGPYTVTATVAALAPANFSLTNTVGAAASMAANAGTTPQSATVNTAFANALAVTVKDAGSNPVPGVNVTFTAPGAGASGTFSNATATITVATNASGVASAPFTANATAGGPYNVTAASAGLTTVNFSLTNTAGTPTSMTANAGTTPQSATINTAFANALAVTVKDAGSNPVSGVNVTFTAPGAGASGKFSNNTATITVATNASGVASAPFTANGTAGGPYTVTAAATGLTTVNFSLTNTAGAAGSMTANAGTTPQSATVNTAFANALAVTVKDAGSNPVSGVNVTFTAPGSGASGKFSNNTATITVATNASGVASAPFTANATSGGPYTVTAAAAGLTTVNFSLTNTAGAAAVIVLNAGTTPQSAAINTAFANPLAVTVNDVSNNPVSGVNITFTAPAAGASGKFSNNTATITVATNASGIASAPFTANGTAGGPYNVTAASAGLTTVNFSLTNTAGAASSMTANAGTTPQSATVNTAFANALAVTVKDAGSNPISGVNVTFTAPGAGASGVFSNSTATITVATNASGVASAPFTANATSGGPYTVTAAAAGLTTVNFSLTNTAGAASTMTANAGTTPQSAAISTAFANALAVTVKDASGNPVSGVNVTFTAPGAGASGVFSNSTATITVATNASGVASAPFTANATVGGPYTVTAAATGLTTVNFSLTNAAGVATTMAANAGTTPQSATVNTVFANALAVTVRDAGNNPVSGINVTFTAPGSGASGKFSNNTATITVATNASGVASAPFTANTTAGGPYNVTAAATGLTTVNFSLTNTAGAAASITATAGTPQSTLVNTAFTTQLQATVKDAGSNLVSGVLVTFAAPGAGASGAFAGGVTTATTNASGVATASVFTANGTAGTYTVTATVAGVAAPANFSLTNNNPVPTVTSLSPTNATAGGAAFLLTINGTGFASGATVTFGSNAAVAPATLTATVITVNIPAADIATAGMFPVVVTNAGPGGGASAVTAASTFIVNNPVPTISNATAAGLTHISGGAAFTMTITGTKFVSSSVVNFNGATVTTHFGTATQLTADIPASAVAKAGNVNVTVTNPAPGGGTTAAPFVFTVDGFTISGPATPPTVKDGTTAMIEIDVTPTANGFTNAVTFGVTGLPKQTTFTFVPPSVTPNGAVGKTILQITTKSHSAVPPSSPFQRPPSPLLRFLPIVWIAALLAGVFAMFVLRRTPQLQLRRYAAIVPLALLLLTGAVLAGCAGQFTGTPKGPAPLVVTATSGTMSQTANVTLTVQ